MLTIDPSLFVSKVKENVCTCAGSSTLMVFALSTMARNIDEGLSENFDNLTLVKGYHADIES